MDEGAEGVSCLGCALPRPFEVQALGPVALAPPAVPAPPGAGGDGAEAFPKTSGASATDDGGTLGAGELPPAVGTATDAGSNTPSKWGQVMNVPPRFKSQISFTIMCSKNLTLQFSMTSNFRPVRVRLSDLHTPIK